MSTRRKILPEGFLGMESTNWTWRICLKVATCPVVNNAGVGYDTTIETASEKIWDTTLNVNLKGTFFCVRAALPALRKSGGGGF